MKNKIVLILALLLAACAQLPSVSKWQEEREWHYLEASGRFAVRAQEQGISAGFDLLRQNGAESITILSPIGTVMGSLCHDEQGAIAMDQQKRIFQAASVEQLGEMFLGHRLPLSALPVWMNGEWVRNEPHNIHTDGSLQQYGWKIQRHSDENDLTRLLILEHDELSARLFFSQIDRSQENSNTKQLCSIREMP